MYQRSWREASRSAGVVLDSAPPLLAVMARRVNAVMAPAKVLVRVQELPSAASASIWWRKSMEKAESEVGCEEVMMGLGWSCVFLV